MMRELVGSNPGWNNLELTHLAHVVVYWTIEKENGIAVRQMWY